MARDKLELGFSANDNMGDYLNIAMGKLEVALAEIYMYLSGGASEVQLGTAIPISRGGTGEVGENGVKKFVANQGIKTFAPILHKHVPVAYCMVGYGGLPKSVKTTVLTGEISFYKVGTGVYKCDVFDGIDISGGLVHIAPDNLGNRNVCAVVSKNLNAITIRVYNVNFNSQTGKFEADTTTPVDVPSNTYMSFVLVNTLAELL